MLLAKTNTQTEGPNEKEKSLQKNEEKVLIVKYVQKNT